MQAASTADLARFHMAAGQLTTNRILSPRVLEAMLWLPREQFVPEHLRGCAYADDDIEIAPGRFLLEPLVLARLIQSADAKPKDNVLDLGCATGYTAAVLSRLAGRVVAVEEDPALCARAVVNLQRLGIDNVQVVQANPAKGFPERGPYDIIFIGGGVEEVPDALLGQFARQGRLATVKMLAPRPDYPGGFGHGLLLTKRKNRIFSTEGFDAGAPLLPWFKKQDSFLF